MKDKGGGRYVSGLNNWVDVGTIHSEGRVGLSSGVGLAVLMRSVLGMFHRKATKTCVYYNPTSFPNA